jgi:FlaA1/EpsC-like NDP-sugar epimerase
MILVSNDESYKYFDNVDDKLGERVDIPTVIIKKSTGDLLKDYIKKNPNTKLTISAKFTGKKEGEKLLFEYFLRSDDVKAIHFFKEFEQYFNLLKDHITFKPIYKYYKFFDKTSDSLSPSSTEPCIKNSEFCTGKNISKKLIRKIK